MPQGDPFSESSESAPDWLTTPLRYRCRGLDRQGWIQAIGGLVIALIALLSSYDHIALPTGALQLPQQWGVWFIVASIALVVVGLPRQSATLNWRRDPGIENEIEQYEQRKMQYEQRMKQL